MSSVEHSLRAQKENKAMKTASIEEYHAFFESLWRRDWADEKDMRRALRDWLRENDFTLYDMGLTVYEYHDEDEDGEDEYEPEQWEIEKARRERVRIYEQHVGLLRDYHALERNRKRWEQQRESAIFPGWRLIDFAEKESEPDWQARWAAAWEKVGGAGACKGEMVALLDSPIWAALSVFGLPYPPLDYNSGMGVEEVDSEECAELGLLPEE